MGTAGELTHGDLYSDVWSLLMLRTNGETQNDKTSEQHYFWSSLAMWNGGLWEAMISYLWKYSKAEE